VASYNPQHSPGGTVYNKKEISSHINRALMSVCPCILSIIRNWWTTRCNFLVYLFVPNQLYMFRAMYLFYLRF